MTPSTTDDPPLEDPDRIRLALLDETARSLVLTLTPVIHARIARLLRRRRQGGRDIQQEVEDLTQEVFLTLFADDARALRAWRPERGLSLENFVGLLAERKVQSILRTAKRSPWTEFPAEREVIEDACGATDAEPESQLRSREKLDRAFTRIREELTPLAFEMFFRLLVEEESVASLSASTGMSADAIYAWRSRLSKELRVVADELAHSASWRQVPAAAPRRSRGE